VVARDPLVRSGLATVLSAYPGLVLSEACAHADAARPADVVVWDAPELDAPLVGSAVLALVTAASEARQALRAGAHGVLSRATPTSTIAPAALAVAAGHWMLDAAFARSLLDLEGPAPLAASPISAREQEVLELLAEGLSNRDIATRLGISRHTAKFHVNAILEKLGAASRTEAVVLAARSGLLSL
jgi:DNA-binding NarL/FixJ family response regulator